MAFPKTATKPQPTQIQQNLDNRGKTLRGCEQNTYDSEPDPMPFFGIMMIPAASEADEYK